MLNTKQVYRIIPKPATLEYISETIKEIAKEKNTPQFPEQVLLKLLLKLKLNPYSRSCRSLIDSIKLAYYDYDLFENMSQIYSIIGSKHSCSADKIKSSIRSCIRTVNRFASKHTLKSIFFITYDDHNNVISPKQFINGIVLYLKNNLK